MIASCQSVEPAGRARVFVTLCGVCRCRVVWHTQIVLIHLASRCRNKEFIWLPRPILLQALGLKLHELLSLFSRLALICYWGSACYNNRRVSFGRSNLYLFCSTPAVARCKQSCTSASVHILVQLGRPGPRFFVSSFAVVKLVFNVDAPWC